MLSTAAQQNSDGIRASYNISLLITQTRKSKVQLEKSYYVAVWTFLSTEKENSTMKIIEVYVEVNGTKLSDL
ncbi:Casein kinase [Trichinella pseudospiralis]